MPESILNAALGYARRGWAVLPLLPSSKKPVTKHGVKDATNDHRTVHRWFGGDKFLNVGVALGRPSGVVVVDADLYKQDCAWAELERAHGHPDTFTVETPRHGSHYYFRMPEAGIRSTTRFVEAVEIRSDGLYVVAPPSQTGEGAYTISNPKDPVPLPLWLVGRNCRQDSLVNTGDYVSPVLREIPVLVSVCLPSGPNSNHRCLFKLARLLIGRTPGEKLDAFKLWYGQANRLGFLRAELLESQYLSEFFEATKSACVTPGASPADRAWKRSEACPVPKEASNLPAPLPRLASLFWQMHADANVNEWFLSSRIIAGFLGVTWVTAAKYTNVLVSLKIIEITKPHTPQHARCFRYVNAP